MGKKQFLQRTIKIILCSHLCLFSYGTLNAQQTIEGVGLLTEEKNDKAPLATDHWGQLVGDWDIVVEMFNEDGEVERSFDGEWNWFYIMNGMAIQDVFILPRRKDSANQDNQFYGIGLRIYNEKLNKWQTAYMDTSNRRIDLGEAISTKEKITLFETNKEKDKTRITYFDFQQDTFKWQQEVFDEEKKVWQVTQLIHATRKS